MNFYCPYFLCSYCYGCSDYRKYPETYKTMVRNTIMDYVGKMVQTTIRGVPIVAFVLDYSPNTNLVRLIRYYPDGHNEFMMADNSDIDIDKTTLYSSYLYPSPYSSMPPGGVGSVPPSGGEGFTSGL